VVVGGGIAGLTTAWSVLHGPGDDPTPARDVEVVVLEAGPRPGGKLETAMLAGRPYDVGAEAFLARRPEADRLARRLGLGGDLADPQQLGAKLWLRGRLHDLPPRTVFGVPTDAASLAGSDVLSPEAVARVVEEPLLDRAALLRDATVAEVLEPRFGREVLDTLVEPLLGGVYAGSVDRLGVRATTPMIAAAAAEPGPLTPGLRAYQRRGAAVETPVFRTVVGGTARLVEAVADGLDLRTGVAAVALEQAGAGWSVDTTDGRLQADHVVVAVPGQPAAELLAPVAPVASRSLRAVPYATAVVVATAWPAAQARLPAGSGMLVPRTEGRLVKAATWSSSKWAHLDDGEVVFVRFSVGRVDDRRGLDLDDRLLAELVLDEGREALGLVGEPVDVLVRRWVDGLPQYEVGHAERVAAIRQGLPDGLHVAGALYDGVGIAPTIASAERAAAAVRRG
jgi:oxygen-dependent protoporphyrinogen oxidase